MCCHGLLSAAARQPATSTQATHADSCVLRVFRHVLPRAPAAALGGAPPSACLRTRCPPCTHSRTRNHSELSDDKWQSQVVRNLTHLFLHRCGSIHASYCDEGFTLENDLGAVVFSWACSSNSPACCWPELGLAHPSCWEGCCLTAVRPAGQTRGQGSTRTRHAEQCAGQKAHSDRCWQGKAEAHSACMCLAEGTQPLPPPPRHTTKKQNLRERMLQYTNPSRTDQAVARNKWSRLLTCPTYLPAQQQQGEVR